MLDIKSLIKLIDPKNKVFVNTSKLIKEKENKK